MTTRTPSEPITSPGVQESPWANGLTIFAAAIMVIAGFWQALAGIAALVHDNVYVTTPQYIYSLDLTGWGWIHLLIGAAAVAVGIAVLYGQTWALVTGIVIAIFSAIANFAIV